jgi:hypothetical protein
MIRSKLLHRSIYQIISCSTYVSEYFLSHVQDYILFRVLDHWSKFKIIPCYSICAIWYPVLCTGLYPVLCKGYILFYSRKCIVCSIYKKRLYFVLCIQLSHVPCTTSSIYVEAYTLFHRWASASRKLTPTLAFRHPSFSLAPDQKKCLTAMLHLITDGSGIVHFFSFWYLTDQIKDNPAF